MQLLISFLPIFHSFFIPQFLVLSFLVLTWASLLLALLDPSLCILSHWGVVQLVLKTALSSFGFGAPLLPPYTWWVDAPSHASSYLWSDFLSNWVCSLLHFSRQKLLQWLRTRPRQLRCPCPWPAVRWSLHTDPCANTREQQGGFILSALIVPSPEKLIRFLISLWWLWYPSECFAFGRIWTSLHFLLKLLVMTIFLPLFSEAVCPYNGSLLFNVTSFPKGNSPKNNKIIHLKFIQTMTHLNSCLFKNRAVTWCWCCRDFSSFEYVPRLSILFYVSPLNHVQNRK